MKGKILSGLLTLSLALTAAATPALADHGHHGGNHHAHSQHHHSHGRSHHHRGDGSHRHRHRGDYRQHYYRHHHDDNDFGDAAAVMLFGTALGAMIEQGANGN